MFRQKPNAFSSLRALCNALAKYYVKKNITPDLILYDLLNYLSERQNNIFMHLCIKYYMPHFRGINSSDKEKKFYKKCVDLYHCPSVSDLDAVKASSTFSKFFRSYIIKPPKSKEDYVIRVIRHLKKQHHELIPGFSTDLLIAFFSIFFQYRIYFNDGLSAKFHYISLYEKTLDTAINDHMDRINFYTEYDRLHLRDYELFTTYPSYLSYYKEKASTFLVKAIKDFNHERKITKIDLNKIICEKDRAAFLENLLHRLSKPNADLFIILNNISGWLTEDFLKQNPPLKSLIQNSFSKILFNDNGYQYLDNIYFLNTHFDLFSDRDKKLLITYYNYIVHDKPIPKKRIKQFIINIKNMKDIIDTHSIKDQFLNRLNNNDVQEDSVILSCHRNIAYLILNEFATDLSLEEYNKVKHFLLDNLFNTKFDAESLFILKVLPTFMNNVDKNELNQLNDFYNRLMTFISTSSIALRNQSFKDSFLEAACVLLKKLEIKLENIHIDNIMDAFISRIKNIFSNDRGPCNLFYHLLPLYISMIKYFLQYQLINDKNMQHFTLRWFYHWQNILKQNTSIIGFISIKNIFLSTLIGYSRYLPLEEKNILLKNVLNLINSKNSVLREEHGLESIIIAIKKFGGRIKLFTKEHYHQIMELYLDYYTAPVFYNETKIMFKDDISIFKFLFNLLPYENQMKVYLKLYFQVHENEKYRSSKMHATNFDRYYNLANIELLLDCAFHLVHHNGNIKSLPYSAIKCINATEKANNLPPTYREDEMANITNEKIIHYRPAF